MAENPPNRIDRPGSPGFWTCSKIAWSLGILASMAVLLTIADPGITTDEPLDVRPGRTYLSTLRARGWRSFDRESVDLIYRDNAEHPPLGRWLLGIASTLGEPIETILRGGPDPVNLYVVSGRVAPSLAFGALVGLVSITVGRRSGRAGGLVAGLSLAIFPRMFAHAHIAALDTFIAFFWTLALLSTVRAIESKKPILWMGVAGLAWGLALLTKIHGWFLAPVVLVWALGRLRPTRAVAGISAWTVVGLATFLGGWPWLWSDTTSRLHRYLGTGVDRISIQVLYFGKVYADRDVPWHYPWFYFVATIPVGLLALGGWGVVRGWRGRRADPFPLLLVGSIALFLALFSTRISVYDGERLFLIVFPLFAMLVGQGFASLWEVAGKKARLALIAVMIGQAYGVVALHPFGLSYFNALVGGLPGAEKLGLELTYWGDAVDPLLVDELARQARPGETAALAPTLAPEQGKVATTRRLAKIPLVIAEQASARDSDWLLVSRRTAYWTPEVRERVARDLTILARSRQGVWLSVLLRARKSGFP